MLAWQNRPLDRVYPVILIDAIQGAPIATRLVKEAIHKGLDIPLDEGLRLEADLSTLIAFTEDAREGPRAFAEKRPPVWQGR